MNQSSIMHNLDLKTMHSEQQAYLEIIDFFKQHKVYANFEKQMCWRLLKSKQEWLLSRDTFAWFIAMVPESKHYILSCPFLNRKQKINGWCLTHHLKWISLLMLGLRHIKNKIKTQ